MSEKSRLKKRHNRIWINNKHDKIRKSIRKNGLIIPIKKKCICCGKKIKYHHVYCKKCWGKRYEKKEI